MRTTLFRLLPAALLALPLVALAAFAQDTPPHRRTTTPAVAPQAPIQQIPYTPPEGAPMYPVYPQPVGPSAVVPPAVPAAPALEEMVKELKQLREKEKKLTAAIREKVKAQRKALDDAERELGGGAPADGITPTIFCR